MKLWRPMFLGVLLGSVAAALLCPKGRKSKRVMAKVKKSVNLLNDLARDTRTTL